MSNKWSPCKRCGKTGELYRLSEYDCIAYLCKCNWAVIIHIDLIEAPIEYSDDGAVIEPGVDSERWKPLRDMWNAS